MNSRGLSGHRSRHSELLLSASKKVKSDSGHRESSLIFAAVKGCTGRP
jgi:hypothetical protein